MRTLILTAIILLSATTCSANSLGATIGAAPLVSANMLYNGIIDDVRIYNRALTPVEIYNLYRYGLAKHN